MYLLCNMKYSMFIKLNMSIFFFCIYKENEKYQNFTIIQISHSAILVKEKRIKLVYHFINSDFDF